MVDIARTIPFLLGSEFQDGQAVGSINPQDMRDLIVTIKARTPAIRVTDPEYGADPTGVVDSTTAINAAAASISSVGGVLEFPPGTYLISASILLKSYTTVVGYGATLSASAAWPVPGSYDPAVTPGFAMIVNAGYAASSITDQTVSVFGLAFDYAPLYAFNGGAQVPSSHAIRFRMVKRVIVRDCRFNLGNDATAMIGCDDTLIDSCVANLPDNAGFDHWEGPSNARVVNCVAYMTPASTPQASVGILFTATDSAAVTALSGHDFYVSGCKVFNAFGVGIFVNTLISGGTMYRARIIGNLVDGNNITDAGIVVQGGGDSHAIEGNTVYQTNGNCAIAVVSDSGQTPTNTRIVGNTIKNCVVPGGSNGAIRSSGAYATVVSNAMIGGSRDFDIGLLADNCMAIGNQTDNAVLQTGITGNNCLVYDFINDAMNRGKIDGLIVTRPTTTTITVSVGVARDGGNAVNIQLSSGMTKTLQASGAWAAGSNQNGLDTGAIAASTTYHVYIIKNQTSSPIATDLLLSLSATAPTMPTGYTFKRRIGAVMTNGSTQIIDFRQTGDRFYWKAPPTDVSAVTVGTAGTAVALSVPGGLEVIAMVSLQGTDTVSSGMVTIMNHPGDTLTVIGVVGVLTANVNAGAGMFEVMTNTTSQITLGGATATTKAYAITHGWIDPRGQNA